jgi:PAS domain S-box-containing protein
MSRFTEPERERNRSEKQVRRGQAEPESPPQGSPVMRAADYELLFQHAHDAILILHPVGERVLAVNRRACELYGFSHDEFIGRSMLELTPAHRRGVDHVRPTLEAGDRYAFETVQLRKDGSEIRLEVHAAAVEFRGRRAILSINRDVTRRRQQEEDLARYSARLEEMVRDRTARLEQANQDLASKNAELESFAYAVAHGFKSPLVTIRGYLSLLLRDLGEGRGDRLGQGIEQIQSATLKMGELVDHLLGLSRAGRIIERPMEVALGELVAETVDLLSGVIGERGVSVEVASDLPALYGDPSRLGEVLQNLVENAVKYIGDAPDPRIEIGAERQGEEVVVHVRDNGIGLDAGDQEKIFGFFERVDDGTAQGMGIGLALTRRIVEVHGGRICVESEGRGRGSTFRFALPVP